MCSESGTDLQQLLSRPLNVKQLDMTLELNAQCSPCAEILVKCTYVTSSKIPAVTAPFQSLSTDYSFGS